MAQVPNLEATTFTTQQGICLLVLGGDLGSLAVQT